MALLTLAVGGAATGIALTLALALIPFDSEVSTAPLVRVDNNAAMSALAAAALASNGGATLVETTFVSEGVTCHAWAVTPPPAAGGGGAPWPVVVMGHGFGSQKDMGLTKYATRVLNLSRSLALFWFFLARPHQPIRHARDRRRSQTTTTNQTETHAKETDQSAPIQMKGTRPCSRAPGSRRT